MLATLTRCAMLLIWTSLGGCATLGLLDWSSTEVSVYGQALDYDKSRLDAIGVNIHDIPSTPDDTYVIRVPGESTALPVVLAADGVLEVQPLMALELVGNTPTAFDHEGFWGVSPMTVSDARDNLVDGKGSLGRTVSAFIECDSDRVFHVHLVRADASRHRWVRIGILDIGPGSHSAARRPLAVVLLPFAVAADIVTLPIFGIAAAFASARN